MEKGKWIFIRDKLMTEVAPPAMSIHYAIPWPMPLPKEWEKQMKHKADSLRNCLSKSGLVDKEVLDETGSC